MKDSPPTRCRKYSAACSSGSLATVTEETRAKWDRLIAVDQTGSAYVAATMYKWDDFRPYLYRTSDYGRTWKKIDNGIPASAFTRVVRSDPHRRGLLYAGTETGVWVSLDDGGSWQRLAGNLPVAPIHDLIVKDTDLVVATHGRSFWILDDLTPLHQIADGMAAAHAGAASP